MENALPKTFSVSDDIEEDSAPKPFKYKKLAIISAAMVAVILLIYNSILFYSSGSNIQSLIFMPVGLSISATSAIIGILIGALFGLPRTSKALLEEQDKFGAFLTNSNMEQISDWLTKLILGASLVNVNNIIEIVRNASHGFGDTSQASYLGIAIIVFSFISGLLFAYPNVAYNLRNNLNVNLLAENDKLKKAAEKSKSVLDQITLVNTRNTELQDEEELSKAQAGVSNSPIPQPIVNLNKNVVTDGNIDLVQEIIEDVIDGGIEMAKQVYMSDIKIRLSASNIRPKSTDFESDPWASEFDDVHSDTKSNVELKAEVIEKDKGKTCTLKITVTGKELEEGSLVVVFLHPTYSRYKRFVRVENGVAEVNVVTSGAFTVGLLANGGDIRLGYDLSKIANAPEWFKNS